MFRERLRRKKEHLIRAHQLQNGATIVVHGTPKGVRSSRTLAIYKHATPTELGPSRALLSSWTTAPNLLLDEPIVVRRDLPDHELAGREQVPKRWQQLLTLPGKSSAAHTTDK